MKKLTVVSSINFLAFLFTNYIPFVSEAIALCHNDVPTDGLYWGIVYIKTSSTTMEFMAGAGGKLQKYIVFVQQLLSGEVY